MCVNSILFKPVSKSDEITHSEKNVVNEVAHAFKLNVKACECMMMKTSQHFTTVTTDVAVAVDSSSLRSTSR